MPALLLVLLLVILFGGGGGYYGYGLYGGPGLGGAFALTFFILGILWFFGLVGGKGTRL